MREKAAQEDLPDMRAGETVGEYINRTGLADRYLRPPYVDDLRPHYKLVKHRLVSDA